MNPPVAILHPSGLEKHMHAHMHNNRLGLAFAVGLGRTEEAWARAADTWRSVIPIMRVHCFQARSVFMNVHVNPIQ